MPANLFDRLPPGREAGLRSFHSEAELQAATRCPLDGVPAGRCRGGACNFYQLAPKLDGAQIYQLDAGCGACGDVQPLGMVRARDGELLPQERARRDAAHAAELEMQRLDPGRVERTVRKHAGERACTGCGTLTEPRYLTAIDVPGARGEFCPDCVRGSTSRGTA